MERSKRTILVVDDVPMFRELGKLFLARSGKVVTADSVESALEAARRTSPDLVVTDLHMPDRDGEELCRTLKADPSTQHIPVVVLTGTDASVDRGRAIRAGADDVLCKPLSRLQLIDAVNRFLRFESLPGLPRIEIDQPVHLVGDTLDAWGTVRNLSRGGLFVETECQLDVRSEVQLQFHLPESQAEIEPTAQVVWRRGNSGRPPGVGLRFVEVDGPSVRNLEDFVFEHSRLSAASAGGAR